MIRPIRILIVDDRIESLLLIVNFLQQLHPDYVLMQSNQPLKALEIAQVEIPDLIISDWEMPEMSGIELIHQLKQNTLTQNIPVIIATGVMINSENLKIALDAGATDFVRKPIDPIELEARVNSAITLSNYIKQTIELKNQELAISSIHLVKSHEFNAEIKNKLMNFIDLARLSAQNKKTIESIIEEIDLKMKTGTWERFSLVFQSIHPNFNKNLLTHFSDLSPAELKLCMFIRMGLSIKDVASILSLTPESVKVARSRLRKKLNIDISQNLETFLEVF